MSNLTNARIGTFYSKYPSYQSVANFPLFGTKKPLELNVGKVEEQRPRKYSNIGGKVAVGSTLKIVKASTTPHLGVLNADTALNTKGNYDTDLELWLPLHLTCTISENDSFLWEGAVAYLVIDGADWGVTDVVGQGQTAIVIGEFAKAGWHIQPNGIQCGGKYAFVRVNESVKSQNSPVVVEYVPMIDACDFCDCEPLVFPIYRTYPNRTVDIDLRAVSGNPKHVVDVIEYTYVINNVTYIETEPKISIQFPADGDYDIDYKVRVADANDNCGCACEGSTTECCAEGTITVTVAAGSTLLCPSPLVKRTYSKFYSYVNAVVATVDYFKSFVTSNGTTDVTAPIALTNTSAIQTAIEEILDTEGFVYEAVQVNYSAAVGNNDNAVFSVVILNAKNTATVNGFVLTIDTVDTSVSF